MKYTKPEENEWIDINERRPDEAGWYKVKMPLLREIEYEVPFVRNGKGNLVWVVPEEKLITHWKEHKKTKHESK